MLPALRVVIEVPGERLECAFGGVMHRHGVREVELVDLTVFGRLARLVWRKQRWRCTGCGRCGCDEDAEIGSARCALTTRAARWSTLHVGRPETESVNGRMVPLFQGLTERTCRSSALSLDQTRDFAGVSFE